MVAATFLLVLTLGLFPAQLGPARHSTDEASRAQISALKKPKPVGKAAVTREPGTGTPRKAIERKDKYDALRQAWGG
jgi:hypothetical protein